MDGSALMKFILFLFLFSFVSGKDIPFEIGEILNYDASFSNIKAARGSLKVLDKETVNGVKTYHVQFTAYTKGITDYLFPIDDVIDLWLTEDSLITVRVKTDIHEGKYHKKSHLDLYHDSGYAIAGNDTIPMQSGTHSPYSLFYFFRNQDISIVNGETLKTIQGKTITPLKVNVEENIQISVPAGDFLCSRVTPERSDKKQFKNKASMFILFSNDDNRYPVKIWLKLKFGALVLELDEIIN
jgi:hypothetical protein